MEKHIKCLIEACRGIGLDYEQLDREGNFLRVAFGDRWDYFQLSKTPFNSEVMHGICRDKMHTYQLLSRSVRMPRTLSFLDVALETKYRQYLEFGSLDAILTRIDSEFAYPLVVKRNRGYLGINVHLCQDRSGAETALRDIFDPRSKHYDYLALAQEFIPTREEYRLVCAFGTPVLLYRRGRGRPFNARYWEVAQETANLVRDPRLEQELMRLVQPVYTTLALGFVGFDIVRGTDGELYLLELNSSPRFDHVIDGSGGSCVVEMYRKTLGLYLDRRQG